MVESLSMSPPPVSFMKRHGWLLRPEGAQCAASSNRSSCSSETGSPVNCLTLRLPVIASQVSIATASDVSFYAFAPTPVFRGSVTLDGCSAVWKSL